ncbi:uncharacterized protein LOC120428747 isoform X1 [Culex pipiens pallens]|uniref:uncharacterized protein LOC120428747 isoform X1 n=1 Tax=Culex pipiens pallens TaxID=42434 RepID=UPI001954A4D9|nr:uncharacterized protein LOC120428747 isoform X1 [Culex pipiens pallens]
MESVGHVTVPLRVGGKKMRKRRELDALVAHSLAKSSGKHRHIAGNGIASHDQLLSNSTDEQEDYSWQPKVRAQSRCRRKRFSCVRTCGPLVLVSCIFLSLGFMYWLYFDIRQQVSEYRIRIEQVSATSQNVPEALQKWHETSKNLEQNQTALNGKLRDIQQAMGNFSTELKQLRDTIEKKNENSQETQLNTLQSNVAKLGSSLNDAITRIQVLEEHRVKSESEQKTLTKSVEDLQTLFAQIRNASSLATSLDGSAAAAANNVTEQNIANIQRELTAQIENLSKNFTGELESLRQKSTWLRTDLVKNKASIDELIENSANISSHVKSVENIWVEMKANLSTLEGGSKAIGDQLEGLQNVTNAMKVSIGSVRDECERYHGQSDTINGELGVLKLRLEKVEQKEVVPPATAATVNVTEQPPPKDPIPNKLNQLFNNNSQPTPSAVDAQKQPASATTSTATPSLPAAGNTSPTATSSNASAAAAAAVASGM